jgi:hypothetical protein
MGKVLSEAAVEQYRRDGYYYPIVLVPPEEAARYRERLESVERDLGGPLRGVYRIKPHLLFTWLAELVRHPSVLDAVEDVIGPDILCWNSSFFTKEASSRGYVSWHRRASRRALYEPRQSGWRGSRQSHSERASALSRAKAYQGQTRRSTSSTSPKRPTARRARIPIAPKAKFDFQ